MLIFLIALIPAIFKGIKQKTKKEAIKRSFCTFTILYIAIELISLFVFPFSTNVNMMDGDPTVIERNLVSVSDSNTCNLALLNSSQTNDFKYTFFIDTKNGIKREDVASSMCPVFINYIEEDEIPHIDFVFENCEKWTIKKESKMTLLFSVPKYFSQKKAYEKNLLFPNLMAAISHFFKPLSEDSILKNLNSDKIWETKYEPKEIKIYVPEGTITEYFDIDSQ